MVEDVLANFRSNAEHMSHRIAKIAHAGQTRDSSEPYITHPEGIAAKMDTPYERILAMLHDAVENTVVRKLGKKPDAVAEEHLVVQTLRIVERAFKKAGYDYNSDIGGGFTVADLLVDLNAITFRRHWVQDLAQKPENAGRSTEELKDMAYLQGIHHLISVAQETGRWQLIEVKMGDIQYNMEDNPKPHKNGLYLQVYPVLEEALNGMRSVHMEAVLPRAAHRPRHTETDNHRLTPPSYLLRASPRLRQALA